MLLSFIWMVSRDRENVVALSSIAAQNARRLSEVRTASAYASEVVSNPTRIASIVAHTGEFRRVDGFLAQAQSRVGQLGHHLHRV